MEDYSTVRPRLRPRRWASLDDSPWPRAKQHVDVMELMARETVIPKRAGYIKPLVVPVPRTKREARNLAWQRAQIDSPGDSYQRALGYRESCRRWDEVRWTEARLAEYSDLERFRQLLYDSADLSSKDRVWFTETLRGFLVGMHPENPDKYNRFVDRVRDYLDALARLRRHQ
jgi:hypothetical protein